MASLFITEFNAHFESQGKTLQVADTRSITHQTPVTTSGTSAQSAAFGDDTYLIRVFCDGNIHMTFGASPTATTNHMPIQANVVEYFAVKPGGKLAAIDR